MSILLIMFIIMAIISILGISILYLTQNTKNKNIIFYFLSVWSIFVTFISTTSLPTNFIVEQIISLSFGFLAIVAVIIKIKKPEKSSFSYILVSISIVLGLLDLFLL